MSRVRVLELIKGLDTGGAEALLLERLRVADHERFDYTVGWLDPHRIGLVPSFESLGLPVHCFGAGSVADWRWLLPMRRQLLADAVDVVHVHSPLMAAGVRAVVRSLARRSRPVLVTTEHSVRHHRLTHLLDVMTVRADDLVIAVSDAVRVASVCRVATDVMVVHHGIDLQRIQGFRSARDRHADQFALADGPRVVSVANFRPEKGHPVLLAAARMVHQRVPAAHFYVAGHGPLEGWVRDQVQRHDMAGYYHVLGYVPDAARLSACADVFALCSAWEGRPVALMEALAAGVPAVVTAVGGIPDLVQDERNGRIIPAADPYAAAGAIAALLTDRQLQERLARGAFESSHAYDMAHSSAMIEQQYLNLVASRRRLAHEPDAVCT